MSRYPAGMPVLTPERTSDHDQVTQPARPATPRGRSLLTRALTGALAIVLSVVMLGGVAWFADLLPSFDNPFAGETIDRSPPAVLEAIADVHEYRAATANVQVLVDVERKTRYVPTVIKGDRTLFLATGSVDGVVDFSGLGEDAVEVDDRVVTITLPPATVSEARIDPDQSYVVSRDRGLLDRVGSVFSDSPTSERSLYLLAEEKVSEAARETDLVDTAERNTRQMLRALLAPLGFERVSVRFE